jgi:hypothetical protein
MPMIVSQIIQKWNTEARADGVNNEANYRGREGLIKEG